MIRKLRNFCENVLSKNGVIWISVIVFIAITSFMLITEFKDVRDLLTYPEEEYQFLEAEAEKIVPNKDFETEYSYEIDASKKDDIKIKVSLAHYNLIKGGVHNETG